MALVLSILKFVNARSRSPDGLVIEYSKGDETDATRSLVLRPGNRRYRDPGYCLGSIRGLPSTDTSLRPAYSWPAGTRVHRRCLVSRSRPGDLVAAHRTDRGSGISTDLLYLCAIVAASVLCCAAY